MPEPVYTATTERLYARLPELYRLADAGQDYKLKRYLSAAVDRLGAIELLADRIAAGALTDVNLADDRWLPFIGQLVGVTLDPKLTPVERRDAVRYAPSGWRAGTKGAVADAAKSELTGTRYAVVRDHSLPGTGGIGTGGQWDIVIITRSSETPQAAAVVNAVLAKGAKPVGVSLYHRAYEATWQQIETAYPTWADLDGKTWTQIEEAGLA
jgi:hypothetical protein